MARDSSQTDVRRALVLLSATVLVACILFAMYWAREVAIPLALAVFITFILAPFVTLLQRRGLGRLPAVIVVVGAALVVSAGVLTVVGSQLVRLTQTLPDYEENIKKKVASLKELMPAEGESRLGRLVTEVTEAFADTPRKRAGSADPGDPPPVFLQPEPSFATRMTGYLSPAAEAVGQAALTFILVVFMLLRREDLRNRMIRLIGHGQVTTTTKAVDETSQRISRYLLVQFLLNAAFGFVVTVGLFFIGLKYEMKYAVLWGFLAFLMRYVPYIGTWIGLIPPALFAFAVNPGWTPVVLVAVLYMGLELFCNNVMEPRLYGKSLGLSEVAQLVATAFWALLWGPIGMILAWPLTTCLLVLGKYVPQWRFLNVLLGDEPVLEPRVAFYQRLAARDPDEAAEIVVKELETNPPDRVYDDVVLPALAAARRDVRTEALGDDDLKAMMVVLREVVEETAEDRPDPPPGGAEDRVRALLVPAIDDLDRAALEVFARLFDPAQWELEVLPPNTLASELLQRIEEQRPVAVVIGSLPVGGRTHTRYLCKRIRAKFPDLKLVVGRWTDDEDKDAAENFKAAGADEVTASVGSARDFLTGWQAVFEAEPPVVRDERARPAGDRVPGTVPA
ncbi:MAG TPA: AI-2E family transporter [Gemmataceae bacterium]|nr:AI-2E family transporter [Gemmataceae bacterium]